MALDAERVQALADANQAHGQQSPILVRPHPADPLRYQAGLWSSAAGGGAASWPQGARHHPPALR